MTDLKAHLMRQHSESLNTNIASTSKNDSNTNKKKKTFQIVSFHTLVFHFRSPEYTTQVE